jgi:hypothetical protein
MAEFCDTNTVRVISDGGLLHGECSLRPASEWFALRAVVEDYIGSG